MSNHTQRRVPGIGCAFAVAVLGIAAATAAHVDADRLLTSASANGLTTAVPTLIWFGGDKNLALTAAADSGRSLVARQLIASGADVHTQGDTPLVIAALRGRTETARVLLEAGANPNAAHGLPLTFAAMNGHSETARLLIQHGANVHELNDQALQSAERRGNVDTARLLRAFGATDPRPLPIPFP
jgi:uncharacterized protein